MTDGGGEVAATREPGGPQVPVDVTWLILERLGDLQRAQDKLAARLDQLDARLDHLDAKIEQQGKDLRADIQRLDAKIDAVAAKLDAKIDAMAAKLDAKIDGETDKLDSKIDNLRNYIVIPVALVLLAAILAHFVPGF